MTIESKTIKKVNQNIYAIFAFTLGVFGAHHFYAKNYKLAILYLILFALGLIFIFPVVVLFIAAFVEGILGLANPKKYIIGFSS